MGRALAMQQGERVCVLTECCDDINLLSKLAMPGTWSYDVCCSNCDLTSQLKLFPTTLLVAYISNCGSGAGVPSYR